MTILFPDVELIVTTALRAALVARGQSVGVGNKYDGQDNFVWVRRDGGGQVDELRDGPRLTLNVFRSGTTDKPVNDLALLVDALMRSLPNGTPLLSVRRNSGPSAVPDTLPRRLLSYDCTTRGVALTNA